MQKDGAGSSSAAGVTSAVWLHTCNRDAAAPLCSRQAHATKAVRIRPETILILKVSIYSIDCIFYTTLTLTWWVYAGLAQADGQMLMNGFAGDHCIYCLVYGHQSNDLWKDTAPKLVYRKELADDGQYWFAAALFCLSADLALYLSGKWHLEQYYSVTKELKREHLHRLTPTLPLQFKRPFEKSKRMLSFFSKIAACRMNVSLSVGNSNPRSINILSFCSLQ